MFGGSCVLRLGTISAADAGIAKAAMPRPATTTRVVARIPHSSLPRFADNAAVDRFILSVAAHRPPKITPGDLDVGVIGQSSAAHLALGDALKLGHNRFATPP
jgi:hypothetical protein